MIIEIEIEDKLIDSLKTIKKECKKYQDCEGCPLVSATLDRCILEDVPGGWKIEPRIVLD